mmetsp:Transcript_64297/g.76117  ORF Transcript_64297/g.76117 Transcript_64297/m.76117 type:complete len:187 (-) Transcript_64297:234-794(-)|eukprot:CAMPEP_0172501424 /NCGR_PEP_ID=MMETSP1066-20121228/149683_1 /TAXON_ID=671091 /ORGANISM="Coscinodiscus wailesii, Strain CCMP2513" /LENGTH=186 /DNA_ID=CAMNT_0013276205 /DNA_START=55 /DNA_END=615 /DNA_ORIENTATION=+
MSEEEPPMKKIKTTGWENYTLNCSKALMKDDEGKHFADIASAPVSTLEGIGAMSTDVLEHLGCKTVKDLATYKYFLLARALVTMAETEVKGDRSDDSVMNVDKGVDKEWESKSLNEIAEAPISALEGLTEKAGDLLQKLGVKCIGDLGKLKYFKWAEAIVLLGEKYEHTKTASERKEEAALKKLAN